jgi:alpha-galactosidase
MLQVCCDQTFANDVSFELARAGIYNHWPTTLPHRRGAGIGPRGEDLRILPGSEWGIGLIDPASGAAVEAPLLDMTAGLVTEDPNHQTGRIPPIKYRFDVAMTGRLGFELRPERVPAEDLPFSRLALGVHKEIRSIVQFGDLYRLSSPYGNSVAALMYLHEGHGVFFAFTLGRDVIGHDPAIRLQGLDPSRAYRLTEINPVDEGAFPSGLHLKEISGDSLMRDGVRPRWKRSDYQSVVVRIDPL